MNRQNKKKFLLILLINWCCATDVNDAEQIKIGNFSLSTSQQPGPLVGFGQNIVDKGDLQVFGYFTYLSGCNKIFSEVNPNILYGIKDDLSLFIQLPYASKFKINNQCSKGIEDISAQIEYAFYSKGAETYENQLTLVSNLSIPTGSIFKNPATGIGAPGFFLGITANHMALDWYYFGALGAQLTMPYKNNKEGNQFLYQLGLSKNISYETDKYIFNWIVEFNGTYQQRDRACGAIDPNSGGNQIILGPSLWFSTQKLILQFGCSWVIYQHLFGCQNKNKYYFFTDVGWKF